MHVHYAYSSPAEATIAIGEAVDIPPVVRHATLEQEIPGAAGQRGHQHPLGIHQIIVVGRIPAGKGVVSAIALRTAWMSQAWSIAR